MPPRPHARRLYERDKSMNIDEFRKAVAEMLKTQYATHLTPDQLEEAMADNEDIVQGAFEDAQSPDGYGLQWEIENAAWNISQCI